MLTELTFCISDAGHFVPRFETKASGMGITGRGPRLYPPVTQVLHYPLLGTQTCARACMRLTSFFFFLGRGTDAYNICLHDILATCAKLAELQLGFEDLSKGPLIVSSDDVHGKPGASPDSPMVELHALPGLSPI